MTKIKKVTEFTVDRSRWVNGSNCFKDEAVWDDKYNCEPDAGETALLNAEGNMCCLGFLCLEAGFKPNNIKYMGLPSEADEQHTMSNDLNPAGYIFDIEDKIAVINDNGSLSERTREAKLKKAFGAAGIKVNFIGDSRKAIK